MQKFTLISIFSFLISFIYFPLVVQGPHILVETECEVWFRHLTGSSCIWKSEGFFPPFSLLLIIFFLHLFCYLNQTLLILICIFCLNDVHFTLSGFFRLT